jgi:hypothetical protein
MMHGHEKSDPVIVAEKPANKAEQPFAEQSVKGANRGGGGGAKGGDQGKCGPAKHAPGAEPGKRDTGAGSHTESFAVTHPRWKPYAGKPPVRLCAGGAG